MNGLPYYKAFPRDFIEGTVGMPFDLKGAYRLLLDLIYMQGGNLPDDPRYISGLLGCSVRAWKKYRLALLEQGKIYLRGDVISNFRADKELETLAKLQLTNRENRARPNKNKDLEKRSFDHTDTDKEREKEEGKPSSKKKQKSEPRGCRLPPGWTLKKHLGEWAVEQGMDELSVRREAERFADYWHSKAGAGAVKLDWDLTWKNWVRKFLDGKPQIKSPAAINPVGKKITLKDGAVKEWDGREWMFVGWAEGSAMWKLEQEDLKRREEEIKKRKEREEFEKWANGE